MCKENSAFKVPATAQKANGFSPVSVPGRIKELEAPTLFVCLKIVIDSCLKKLYYRGITCTSLSIRRESLELTQ